MPNKYSHALVLSHYESRGLIGFPHRHHQPQPSVNNAEPLDSEPNRHQSPIVSVPFSPPRTPLPPPPPLPSVPSTAKDGAARPSSHRSTPSIITEIYAPQPSAASLHPPALPSKPVSPSAETSPTETKGTSLTSGASSLGEATPRTSVSSVRGGSTRKDAETENGRVSGLVSGGLARPIGASDGGPQPPQSSRMEPSRSLQNHHSGAASNSGQEASERAINPDKGVGDPGDPSRQQMRASTLRSIRSHPKLLPAFVDGANTHSFFYADSSSSTRPWEKNRSGTPPIMPLQSHPRPASRASSSPDDAAPPPISRHRRMIAAATKKPDRLSMWKKPSNDHHDSRPMPHTIRDLTPDITPWESAWTSERHAPTRALRGGTGVSDVLPWESSGKPVTTAASDGSGEKTPRKRLSRIRGPLGPGEKKAGVEKMAPRDEGEVGKGVRMSRALSELDDDFFTQFETEGYFWR